MQSYSAALCANYNDLKETNRLTLDSFTSLVCSYLGFRAQTTGDIITTTVDVLARFFNKSTAILNKSLQKLADLGVITITITTNQKGYKRTAIKVISNKQSFFDYEKIALLRNYTKNDELSLLYSFVAYKLTAYDKLNQPGWLKEIDGQIWWRLDTKRIAEQFSISERTAFRNVSKLLELGLLIKRREGLKTYYAINDETYKTIADEHQELLINKRPKFDFGSKFTDTSEVSSINNTFTDEREIYINNNTRDCDIILNNLDSIGKDLNKRQIAYLLAAIKATAKKMKFNISEIFGWIKFAILNPCQRKGTTNFKHAVNRFIKLLRERKLTMPFGYNKYTEEGRQYWAESMAREEKKQWRISDDTLTPAALAERAATENDDSETWRDILEVDAQQSDRTVETGKDRLVLGEMSNKETEGEIMQEGAEERGKRLLNEKAERFAKAVAEKSKEPNANATILEHLWRELDRCIDQGADVKHINDILGGA